jgi:hypothetical protein
MKVRDEAFRYYFYFMQERMRLFWNRYNQEPIYLVDDVVLTKHRFTNVYRAADRVSQYLIKNIIYADDHALDPESLLLNILVFKIFNRVSTWELLKAKFGYLDIKSFQPKAMAALLNEQIKSAPIFNPAYIMTASSDKYRYLERKHERWLEMVKEEVIKTGLLSKILAARSLEEVYLLLRSCTFVGPFLAYQYSIDINYSSVINFSENSFVVAGIGAQRGIRKCFASLGEYSYEDAIRFTQENLSKYREEYGHKFEGLPGREPALIDLQNCFCETDKLLRVKLPDLLNKNSRIKQLYRQNQKAINFQFPPKWKVHHNKI